MSVFQLGSSAHFKYFGKEGTDTWPEHFADCLGLKQSPIDIDTSAIVEGNFSEPLKTVGYNITESGNFANNGHSVQYTLDNPGNQVLSGGPLNGSYVLLQLHFHWGSDDCVGSEHTVNGKQ